jgi:hypothetical protein
MLPLATHIRGILFAQASGRVTAQLFNLIPYAAFFVFLLMITPGNCTTSSGAWPFWP